MTIVKICGLNSAEAVDAALAAGADLIGFVVFPDSPRHVSLAQAEALAVRAGGGAAKVLLTVDADDALLAAAIAALAPEYLQMHGAETPGRVAAARAKFGLKIIKAIGVDGPESLEGAKAFAGAADMLLFDARAPRAATRPGGNGAAFDWRLLCGISPGRPWLLAGGLDAGNVAQALRICGAPGVDVSSGVESAPGVKDRALIEAFVAAARGQGAGAAPAAPERPASEKLGVARRGS